nr:MAG TPA: hypothetical protein [Caudoviricetes sp.]DAR52736.1 MAG TPA: hypothetical protein [Caudoviricetes sp.]
MILFVQMCAISFDFLYTFNKVKKYQKKLIKKG